MDQSLKTKTALTLKWNILDRVATQVLYGITGIVLARVLSQEDFGLVGAILVFQAFASLLVESGFSSALIQRKAPTQADYSTVLWFNIGISVLLYIILYMAAPLIARCFQNSSELIPLSRVMFLSLILNAAGIVQANRLMKQMNVRPIAATNAAGLIAGGITGIYLALNGYGAWAIVWQTIVNSAVKTILLWISVRWMPSLTFSLKILRGFFAVGSGIMVQSFLNTLFQNIYSFFIGNRVGLVSLGYYSQADKWSKMGIMSLSQSMTSTFLPALSDVQDDAERFNRVTIKINRFCGYILFPFTILLILTATPIFHTLFGEKWDASILLFQLLLIRGVFTVLTGIYNNILLSKAKTGLIVRMEIIRDVTALIALFATFPVMGMQTADNPTYGISIMLYGQIAASLITWIATLAATSRTTGISRIKLAVCPAPYLLTSCVAALAAIPVALTVTSPILLLILQSLAFIAVYLILNRLLGSEIQKEAISMILKKKGAQP